MPDDLLKLKEFLDCDEVFLIKVIESFLRESANMIKSFDHAIATGNNQVVRGIAHKMQSSTEMFGLKDLSKAFYFIETEMRNGKTIFDLTMEIDEARDLWRHSCIRIRLQCRSLQEKSV